MRLILLILLIFTFTCSGSSIESQIVVDNNESVLSNEEKAGGLEHNLSSPVYEYKPKIEDLCEALMGYVGEYLDNPVATLGSLNRSFRGTFKGENSLKYYVKKRFNIPELESIDQNEPELAGILNLVWCRYDEYFIFLYLMKEMARENCPYKVLFRPLIGYLARTFKELNDHQREQYTNHLASKCIISFDVYLADLCAKNGHYDLAFEFLKNHPRSITFCFAKVGDRVDLFSFYKLNPSFGIHYERVLVRYELANIDNNELHYLKIAFHWIGECIIYDAPEEFYRELLDLRPRLLKTLIESDWFLSSNVPEHEYPRIHSQIRNLVEIYLEPRLSPSDYNFCNLINDIRFASESSVDMNTRKFEQVRSVIVSKAALFANNRDLFLEINEKYNPYEYPSYKRYKIISEVVKLIYNDESNSNRNKLKVIFEFIVSNIDHFSTNYYFYFIMKYYAVNHLRIEGDQIVFEFVAFDDLISLGFPPVINAKMKDQINAQWFIDTIFSHIKVVNEDTLLSFLHDYMNSFLFKKSHSASFEVLELISRSPRLLELVKKIELQFWFYVKPETFTKHLDLTNFDDMAGIIERFHFFPKNLVELRTKDHFRRAESVQKKTVAEYFLEHELSIMKNGRLMDEVDYFDWRWAFAYWIKSSEKERIREIQSPKLIEMLKLEYPVEMKTFLDG